MNKNEIMFRCANEKDAQAVYNLMHRVYADLDDKSVFVCDDIDFIKEHIEAQGFAVVAYTRPDTIVGSFIIRYPMQEDDNLGNELALSEEELQKVVHMESVVVAPEYRGRALQAGMLEYAENLIDKKRYTYFMATVAPTNPASYKTFERNGYELLGTKEKYGGLLRMTYLKRMESIEGE